MRLDHESRTFVYIRVRELHAKQTIGGNIHFALQISISNEFWCAPEGGLRAFP